MEGWISILAHKNTIFQILWILRLWKEAYQVSNTLHPHGKERDSLRTSSFIKEGLRELYEAL